ncbi:DUF2138 family protein [Pseudomonas aeruginosa]
MVTPGLYGVSAGAPGGRAEDGRGLLRASPRRRRSLLVRPVRGSHSPLLVGQLSAPASAELDDELGKLFGRVIDRREGSQGRGRRQLPGGRPGWMADPPLDPPGQLELRRLSGQPGGQPGQHPAAARSSASAWRAMAQTLLFSPSTTSCSARPWTPSDISAIRRSPRCCRKDALVPAYLAPQRSPNCAATGNPRQPAAGHGAGIPQCRRLTYLMPRLKTLAGKGSYALWPACPGSQANAPWQWLPLEWRSL